MVTRENYHCSMVHLHTNLDMIQTPLMSISVTHTVAGIRATECSLMELTPSSSSPQKFTSLPLDEFPPEPAEERELSSIGPVILLAKGNTKLVTPNRSTPSRKV